MFHVFEGTRTETLLSRQTLPLVPASLGSALVRLTGSPGENQGSEEHPAPVPSLFCKTDTGFPEREPLVTLPFSVTHCRSPAHAGSSFSQGCCQGHHGSSAVLPGCRCLLTPNHL